MSRAQKIASSLVALGLGLLTCTRTASAQACDYNWTGTYYQNNCPSSWNGTHDGCDCGCQFTDPDCGGGAAGKIGAIGDSISTAMDADDDCDTLTDCAGRIGEDRAHSWTTGYSNTNAFRMKLGYSATTEQQRNGARWDDALGQAQAVVAAGGASLVTIELGGNDICRRVDDTLPTRAEIEAHIDATFSTLANGLAPGAQVVVGEVPDVVHLRDTMRYQKNFVFETCQDLWDLNTSAIRVNTCDWGFFDFLCDIADFIIETTADFVSPLSNYLLSQFDVEFPCGYVLSSASNDTKRALARQLNNDINAALAAKVAQWNGVNGVSFRLATNVYEFQFTSGDVSKLDCFHPNRQGQANLAKTIWDGAGIAGAASAAVADTSPPYLVSTPTHYWAENYTAIYSTFNTNENASLDVWTAECTSADLAYPYGCYNPQWHYQGQTNETPTYHDIKIRGLDYAKWWQVWVLPQDTSGNWGTGWYYSSFM